MIRQLQLTNFKSFQQAKLELGGLTLLVGTNAAGKSNLRDAVRFLHGVGRGYSLSDSIGGRFGEGGERIWGGIRGGPREIAFDGAHTFTITVSMVLNDDHPLPLEYHIEVDPGQHGQAATLVSESLRLADDHPHGYLFHCAVFRGDVPSAAAWVRKWDTNDGWQSSPLPDVTLLNQQRQHATGHALLTDDPRVHAYGYDYVETHRPALGQLVKSLAPVVSPQVRHVTQLLMTELASMRFFDLNPDSMRQPSFPGQLSLGDRGENLSSVLQAICADEVRRQAMIGWLQALTPMDAVDFQFPSDPIGKIIAVLIEADGRRTTAYSASDGTLRFLAILAALLGPEPAQLYVFEELENGIHPTRLHLLLQMIEQQTTRHAIQVLATTHSPQVLRLISPQTLRSTSLVYRLSGRPDSEIRRLLDIPHVEQVLQREDMAQLHDSGWFEDAMAFAADEDA